MSTGRPKRHITVPKKFAIEEGYNLPDSPERNRNQSVLRFLNEGDAKRALQDLTVYVLWPDDNLWYEAVIQKAAQEDQSAKLFYVDTAEEEIVDLNELISDRHIAFLEMRPTETPLKEDELLADNLIHVSAATQTVSEALSFGEGSSGNEGSSSSHDRFAPKIKNASSHLIPSRPSHFDATQMLIQSSYHESEGPGFEPAGMQGSSLLHSSQSEGTGMDRFAPGKGEGLVKLRTSSSLARQPSISSREAKMTLQLDVMTKLRERTVAQLTAILNRGSSDSKDTPPKTPQTTTEETLVKEDEAVPDPDEHKDESVPDEDPIEKLAKAIEIEMMKLCGGENGEYKSKFRTLYFNLKDARNPELRRRVLAGEITPEQLVSMSPRELASQELIEWRQKKQQELLQATVLDEDAAAQFSTAAALKQLESIRSHRLDQADTEISAPVDPPQLTGPVQEASLEEMVVEHEGVSFGQAESSGELPTAAVSFDGVADEMPQSTAVQIEQPAVEGEVLDMEDIPDWAMDVVEAPVAPEQTQTPLLYSPKAAEERNNSVFGPVPIPATVPDLTPLLMKDDGSVVAGESVWQGEIGFAEQTPFKAQCIAIAGKCNLKAVLSTPQIVVQGRMNLKKVEDFLEKLRTSKSRTVTIAILRPPSNATEEDIAAIQENVHYYLSRERTGAMVLAEGVEGYLIAKCALTGRLLSAAQILMEDIEAIPSDIDVNEFLLVVVHKKDWTPVESLEETQSMQASVMAPAPVQEDPEPAVLDPRIRAGILPVVQEKREATGEVMQFLPSGLTLESISSLAAKLGVQKSAAGQSSTPPMTPVLPPHQMTVPTGVQVTAPPPAEAAPQQQQQQGSVVVQPERPKYLIFDPTTSKVIPLNPAAIQYDSASNSVVMMGPLPQGFAMQQMAPTLTADAASPPERLVVNAQGVPIVMKTPQGDSRTDTAQTNDPSAFLTGSGAPLAQRMPNVSSVMQRLSKPLVQPMVPGGGSSRGRANHRRPRSSRSGVNRSTASSSMQAFPENGSNP